MTKRKRPLRKCEHCGRVIEQAATGRPPKWCSRGCRQRAYDHRRLDAAEQAGRMAGREEAAAELRGRSFLA